MSYKLYFETNEQIFAEFIQLITSLKESIDDNIMILFNKDGMRIHRETDENFILCASWDATNEIFSNYFCPIDIKILVNLQEFYDNLIFIFKKNLYEIYIWQITDDDNDNLYIYPK